MEKFIKFLKVIKKNICQITDYKTRSNRSEYFYWYLMTILASSIIGIIVGFIMEFIPILGEILLSIFLLFIFVVSLPLSIRRLNDIGKNPWLILIGLIPIVGQIILLFFFCRNSKYSHEGKNKLEKASKDEEASNNKLVNEKQNDN